MRLDVLVLALTLGAAASSWAQAPVTPRPVHRDRSYRDAWPDTLELLKTPVRVVARLQGAKQGSDEDRVALDVSDGRDCYRLGISASVHFGRPERLVADLRRSIGWRDRYLFVPFDGGAANRWKGVTEAVFMMRDGRIVPIGSLIARADTAVVGSCYRDSAFFDLYDDLEGTDLTSHGGAPGFPTVLREREGRLEVDVERTWSENLVRSQRNDSLAREATRVPDPSEQGALEAILSPLFENAAIARLCGRTHEFDATLTVARRWLPARTFDGLQRELAAVRPGQPARSCTLATEPCPPAPAGRGGR